jgi:SPP1 gp7 family putative phage head morphogenesis protein
LNHDVIARLTNQLGEESTREVVRLARRVQKLEGTWLGKIEEFYRELAKRTARRLLEKGVPPEVDDIDFEDIFTEFWFDVQIEAFESVERFSPIPKRMSKKKRTLKDLIKERNAWRKGKYRPKTPKGYAKSLKEDYLKKIKAYWKKNSEDFLSGESYNQDQAFKKLTEDLELGESRANTIIRTETTRYYNEVRKEFYDQVPSVTHYLLVCIRDYRTTQWCKDRDGLVYKKGSKFSWEIPPPCHWNCRSEILPLDPDNPNHKKLIDDRTLWREHRTCKPLPRGFKTR